MPQSSHDGGRRLAAVAAVALLLSIQSLTALADRQFSLVRAGERSLNYYSWISLILGKMLSREDNHFATAGFEITPAGGRPRPLHRHIVWVATMGSRVAGTPDNLDSKQFGCGEAAFGFNPIAFR